MELRTAHPNQPWLWRADWAAGEIHYSPRAKAILFLLVAIIWNCCTFMVLASLRTNVDPDRTNISPWMMLFPLVGITLLFIAMRALLQWRVYGESTFQLKLVPGTIGGALEGVIRSAHPLPAMRPVKLHLTCVNSVRGADNKINDLPIWSDQLEATTDDAGVVPVAIYIPSDCRPTATEQLDDRVTWRLKVSAPGTAVPYLASFEVPIFACGETSARPSDANELRTQREARVNAFQAPEKSRIRVALAADGATEVFFPAFRNPGVALMMLSVLALWLGITMIIFEDRGPLIFKIAWPLMDVLLGSFTLALLLGSTSAHARNGEITIVSRLLGIPIRQRHLPLAEINDIRSASGMSAGRTVYRRIQIHRAGNEIVSFGDGIPDSIEADWIASTLAKAVGLPDDASARAEKFPNRPAFNEYRRSR
jgi:hypothetical protein